MRKRYGIISYGKFHIVSFGTEESILKAENEISNDFQEHGFDKNGVSTEDSRICKNRIE